MLAVALLPLVKWMLYDTKVQLEAFDFAHHVNRDIPKIPSLGSDIIQDHTSGKLHALVSYANK